MHDQIFENDYFKSALSHDLVKLFLKFQMDTRGKPIMKTVHHWPLSMISV